MTAAAQKRYEILHGRWGEPTPGTRRSAVCNGAACRMIGSRMTDLGRSALPRQQLESTGAFRKLASNLLEPHDCCFIAPVAQSWHRGLVHVEVAERPHRRFLAPQRDCPICVGATSAKPSTDESGCALSLPRGPDAVKDERRQEPPAAQPQTGYGEHRHQGFPLTTHRIDGIATTR